MKSSQVQNCSFEKWYPKFKHLSFESEILPLSQDFIEYLKVGEFHVPESAFPVPDNLDRYDDGEAAWSDEEEDSLEPRTFPELELQIQNVIKKYGAVFPKLNWSSPKVGSVLIQSDIFQDASWMNTSGTLKCTQPSDVLLLLKSSDFVQHDLSHAFENCTDEITPTPEFVLVLRKWQNLKPSNEFRCFVKNNQLIGVSQRDPSQFWDFLVEQQPTIQSKIQEFFDDNIKNQFFDIVFDVYVTQAFKVYLVDFNPWGPTTDALLFDWEELEPNSSPSNHNDNNTLQNLNSNSHQPSLDFRIVTSQIGIKPLSMANRVPLELADNSGALADLIEKLKQSGNVQ